MCSVKTIGVSLLLFVTCTIYSQNATISRDSLHSAEITIKRNKLLIDIEKGNFASANEIVDELWDNQTYEGQYLSLREYLLTMYWLNRYTEILKVYNMQPAYPFAEIEQFSTIFSSLSMHSHIHISKLFEELKSIENSSGYRELQDLLIILVYATHSEAPFDEKYPYEKLKRSKVSYPSKIESYLSKKNRIDKRKAINTNPKNAVRIDVIFPGINLEKKIFKDVTLKTGIAMGLRTNDAKTHPTIVYQLESRFYLGCYCRDEKFKFCGEYFAFSFQNVIHTNGDVPNQEYLFYGGISGKLFWRVYGEIGFGFGAVTEGGKAYPLFSFPGSIGIIL